MKIQNWLLIILSIALLLIIFSNINIKKVFAVISNIDYNLYFLYLAILCLMIMVKAFKWKLILNSMGADIKLLDSFRAILAGLFFSNVTPGKIGDFFRAMYVNEGKTNSLGLASVFLDRLFDIIILLIFGIISIFWISQTTGFVVINQNQIIFLLIIIIALSVFLTKEKYVKMMLKPAFEILIPKNIKEKISKGFSEFYSSIRATKKKQAILAISFILSIIMWLANAVLLFILASAIKINAPFYTIIAIFPIMALSDLVPLSISGLGTREAVMIFMFSIFSLPLESAVALSLLVFFNGYFIVSLAGFISFLSKPVKVEI
jgi:hypothetical protein